MIQQNQRDEVIKFLKEEVQKIDAPAPTSSNESTTLSTVEIKTEPDDNEMNPPCLKKPHLEREKQASAMKYLLGDYYEISDDESMNDEVDEYFCENPSQMCPLEFWTKVKVGVLRPVQQPGSYWDRSSELPLVGLEPTEVTAYD